MSPASTTVRGIVKTLAGQWSKFLIQIGGTAVLARLLSPSEYGTIAMIMALIGVATLLADFGLSLASLRKPDMSKQQRSNLFWINVMAGGAATFFIILLAGNIAQFYGNPQLKTLVAWLSVTFVVQAAVGQFRSELASQLRFGRLVIVDVLAQMVATVTAIVLATYGAGYWALGLQQISFCVLQLIGLALISRWLPMLPRGLRKTKSDIAFGSKSAANQFINYLSSNIDSVLLGKVWGAAVLGVYNQGYNLYRMPVQQIASPLTQVIVPALSRCSRDEFQNHVLRLQSALTYSVGGAFVVLASISHGFITLLLGQKWTEAVPIFTILALGGTFQVLGFVYYWVFIIKNLAGRHLVFGGVSRIIMVVLISYFVQWGGVGVAWAVTVGLILNWAMLTLFVVPFSGIKRTKFLMSAARPVLFLSTGFILVRVAQSMLSKTDLFEYLVVSGAIWIGYSLLMAAAWKGFRRDVLAIWGTLPSLMGRKNGRINTAVSDA